ncbi:antibiotic biosynthesis monooxygenase [uncultured Serinicoccus sp.]|uniref:putative quinol monooxygenase n=1 Tax=uncultured Serinicoccus sp. TaxID=735514 RepID=UPI002620EE14|nr:antibiotic biosynthesis monooxygenase [uncultured Serinicoccus sp.]
MPVQLVAIIETGEEGQSAVADLLAGLISRIRGEDGCERYDVFTSGRSRLVLLEQWRDGSALQQHTTAPSFVELMADLERLAVPAPTVHVLRPVAARE